VKLPRHGCPDQSRSHFTTLALKAWNGICNSDRSGADPIDLILPITLECWLVWGIGNMHDDDDDWRAAEAALEKARSLPGRAERIEALRQAGKLRFAADQNNKEQGARGCASKYTPETE
jgi:hypothetical protein